MFVSDCRAAGCALKNSRSLGEAIFRTSSPRAQDETPRSVDNKTMTSCLCISGPQNEIVTVTPKAVGPTEWHISAGPAPRSQGWLQSGRSFERLFSILHAER